MTNENKTTATQYEVCKTSFAHSTLLSIFNKDTQECVYDVMSHEVGGIKEARRLIKKKLKELMK